MTSKYAALPGYFKAYPSFSAGPIDGRTNEHLQFTGFSSWTDIASTIPADSKLLILARHGEGYHNAANAFYGDQAWDDYWSLLDGDGNTTWLDAQLTPKGIQQTLDAGKNILTPLVSELGLPDIFYVSPLRRCIETFIHEWSTVLDASGFSYKGENVTVNVREALRETIGEHTCDKRLNHSTVYNTYQGSPLYDAVLNLEYEPCYPEQDAVWTSTERETDSEMDTRFAKILDQILDRPERYISVTYHSGAIESTLRALSHPHVKHLPTAGFVFVVVGPRWRVQPALRPLPQQSNSSS